MANNILPPYANNSTAEPQMFEQRLLYRKKSFSRLLDPTPLDILYEKPFYGKVDIYGTPIYPSEINLTQLPGEGLILVLDFVAAAFKDLKEFIDNAMATTNPGGSGQRLFTDMFSSFVPTSGFVSIHQAYNDHFINNVFEIFANKYINVSRINRKIRNFDDLAREFLNYTKLMSDEFPVTKSAFITSPHCPNAISGLFIEMENLPHGDDLVNYGRFLSAPSFSKYLKAAAKFGFYVDKNAPWRLIANIDSPAMTGEPWKGASAALGHGEGYMSRFGVSLEDNSVFSTYFYESEFFSYESIKARLWNMYVSLINNPKTSTYGTIYETRNCMKASWAPITSSTYKTKIKEGFREKVSIYFDDGDIPIDLAAGEAPPQTFKQQYNDEYFLPFYLKLRLAESNVKYNKREFTAIMKKAFDLHRTFGIEAAVAHVGQLVKQTKIYKKVPTDKKPPFGIKYFGDSTSSGLHSYAKPAIMKQETV